jgi:hypothetical protein
MTLVGLKGGCGGSDWVEASRSLSDVESEAQQTIQGGSRRANGYKATRHKCKASSTTPNIVRP